MHILLVEDDCALVQAVCHELQDAGHTVDCAGTGRDALRLANAGGFDVVLMDRLLPGGVDGLHIVEALRLDGFTPPVLFLTGLAEVDERVRGLRSGGDDYLPKPFAGEELLARVEALGRRGDSSIGSRLVVGDLELDRLGHRVLRGGRAVPLQPQEFRLLEYLMRHADHLVSRAMLLDAVWGYDFDPHSNVIDVHISRLRRKLDAGRRPTLIHTIRAAGYVLSALPPATPHPDAMLAAD